MELLAGKRKQCLPASTLVPAIQTSSDRSHHQGRAVWDEPVRPQRRCRNSLQALQNLRTDVAQAGLPSDRSRPIRRICRALQSFLPLTRYRHGTLVEGGHHRRLPLGYGQAAISQRSRRQRHEDGKALHSYFLVCAALGNLQEVEPQHWGPLAEFFVADLNHSLI